MAGNFDEVDFVEFRLQIELVLPEFFEFVVDLFEVGELIGECFGLDVDFDGGGAAKVRNNKVMNHFYGPVRVRIAVEFITL